MKSLLRSIARWWEWRALLRRPGDEILSNAFFHVRHTAHKDALLVINIATERVRNAPLIELINKANRANTDAAHARRTSTGLLGTPADRSTVARSDQALGDGAARHRRTDDGLHLQRLPLPSHSPAQRNALDVAPACRGSVEVHGGLPFRLAYDQPFDFERSAENLRLAFRALQCEKARVN